MEEKDLVKEIIEESKKIQKVLNEEFLNTFAKLHNINPEFSKFEAKQENVAKTAYFLHVKKKYALYIVNSEGVDCSEYDLKGLTTQRSDYPAITRERLKTLLDYLIKDEKISFKKIRDFVEKTRKEILELIIVGDKRIGRPVNFNKPEAEYKEIPSHVNGMLLWNKLVYPYFVPGTRGYQIKIKGVNPYNAPKELMQVLNEIDFTKYNNIALPYEEERLPDWFEIDIEKNISFVWDDRINEILEPIQDKLISKKNITKAMTW